MNTLVLLLQPHNHVYRGRQVWVSAADVAQVTTSDDTGHGECLVMLRSGEQLVVMGDCLDVGQTINKACAGDHRAELEALINVRINEVVSRVDEIASRVLNCSIPAQRKMKRKGSRSVLAALRS